MEAKDGRTIGILWYQQDTYARVRRIMEDADVLPRDYGSWLRSARSVVEFEHARGSDIVKAPIDPDAFVAWCHATGQRADVHARTRHVNLAIEDYCNALASVTEFGHRPDVTPQLSPESRESLG